MTEVRTPKEIEIMRECGALLSRALGGVVKAIHEGIRMSELDGLAERLIREAGGEPSFKGYSTKRDRRPFPATLCISRNEEVVHGPGSRDLALKEGDVVGLDVGAWYKGLCTDMAVTVPVGKVSKKNSNIIKVTRESMLVGLGAVRSGAAVSEIGRKIEEYVKPYGYGIVHDLVGHGVGKKVHEDPHIPNFYDARYDNVKLKAGMTIAVEPMLTDGDWHIKTLDDGWTIVTADGSIGSHFEVTVLVTKDGYEFLTPMIS